MRVKLKKYKTIIFLLNDEIESQKTVIKGKKIKGIRIEWKTYMWEIVIKELNWKKKLL